MSLNRRFKISIFIMMAVVSVMLMLSGCRKGPDKYELRDQAIELYNKGDLKAAITAFNEVLAASDGQVSELQYDILKYRGECEIRTGDYVSAKNTYAALVKLVKDEGDLEKCQLLLDELGQLDEIKAAADIFAAGNYGDAYDAFSAFAELDGSLTGRAAVFNKAVCAEYMGRFDEALELFSSYLGKYPDDAAAKKEADFCRSRL